MFKQGSASGRYLIPALLCVLAGVYVLCFRTYFLGFFNDDASYVLGARMLAAGHYVNVSTPGNPPMSYLPGYPLLLAPVLQFFGGSDKVPKVFSLLMTIAAVGGFALLGSRWLSPRALIASLLLFGLSPLTAGLSSAVVAEVPFLLLCAAVFLHASRRWEGEGIGVWLGIGLLAGFGGLLRPNGIALPLALAGALALERRWRSAALCVGAGLAPAGLYYAGYYFSTGQAFTYFKETAAPYSESSNNIRPLFVLMGSNLLYYGRGLFANALFPSIEGAIGQAPLEAMLVAGAFAGVGAGLSREWRPGWTRALGLFLAAYLALLLFWFKQSPRYLLPVLPVAAAFLFHGIGSIENRAGLRRPYATWGTLALGLLLAALPLRQLVRASLFEYNSVNTPPLRTYTWILQNTQPRDVFAAEPGAQLFLYTRRKSFPYPRAANAGRLGDWAEERGVKYIVSAPDFEAMLSDLRAFQPVFSDPLERITIYRPVPPVLRMYQRVDDPRRRASKNK